ncbi:MAG: SEC-C metal-binding domain-containing protein [Nitrospinota bacterium]
MSTIGRNDPCLCGSGKKYKKCCLPKTYIEIGKENSIREGLVHEILTFAKKRFGNYIDDAYDYFWDEFDPEEELDEKLLQFSDVNFWEWLAYDWIPDEDDGRTLIEHFIEINKRYA